MFDKMKQLYDMQKQAKQMQKITEAMKVEKSGLDGGVQLVLNGQFKVEKFEIQESLLTASNKSSLEKTIKTLFNDAAEEVAKQSAAQAMEMMKNMNIKMPF